MENDNIIILASDHNGVSLKKRFVERLKKWGYMPIDIGPYISSSSVDYVDYAKQVGNIIHTNPNFKGVLICGTGVGMSIVINRQDGIRAALVHNLQTAAKCREHNNSNVLCVGSWINSPKVSEEILNIWLREPYGEGRHNKRLSKISDVPPHKIVFTNGVFDILHKGHIELLRHAKRLGDKLIVAINDDRSVRSLKGNNRPVNEQEDRKRVLQSLREVDEVVIFDGDLKAIRERISPHVVVKGGEWTDAEVRKRDEIPPEVEIEIFPLVKDYSTTNVLKKIQLLETHDKKEFQK